MNPAWIALAASLEQAAAALRQLAVQPEQPGPPVMSPEPTWREKLWSCDPQVRLGVKELCEATGKPRSWVYRAVHGTGSHPPLPHRRLAGSLQFVVGAVRCWITSNEVIEVPGRVAPLANRATVKIERR